jgi:HSP20 family protein
MPRKDIMRGSQSKRHLPAMRHEGGSPFMALQHEMNRLFDRFFGREMEPFYGEEWFPTAYPQLDVKETDKDVKVSVELPGMDEKDIQISMTGNSLTIKGEKKEEKEEKEANYIRTERRYGMFNRVVQLPEGIDSNKASAYFKNGLLEIEIPKSEKEAAQKKKIDIKTH